MLASAVDLDGSRLDFVFGWPVGRPAVGQPPPVAPPLLLPLPLILRFARAAFLSFIDADFRVAHPLWPFSSAEPVGIVDAAWVRAAAVPAEVIHGIGLHYPRKAEVHVADMRLSSFWWDDKDFDRWWWRQGRHHFQP